MRKLYTLQESHLDKLLNGCQNLHIEGFGLDTTQVHVTQKTVDYL